MSASDAPHNGEYVGLLAEALHADSDHGKDGCPLDMSGGKRGICNCAYKARVALDALRSLPVEQRMEAMGMQAKVWHFAMDFDPHPECNARCRTVWEEEATHG